MKPYDFLLIPTTKYYCTYDIHLDDKASACYKIFLPN